MNLQTNIFKSSEYQSQEDSLVGELRDVKELQKGGPEFEPHKLTPPPH